jgi:hypothetical protein
MTESRFYHCNRAEDSVDSVLLDRAHASIQVKDAVVGKAVPGKEGSGVGDLFWGAISSKRKNLTLLLLGQTFVYQLVIV